MCPIGKSETHCSVRAVTGREEGGEGRISRSRNFKPTTHTARDTKWESKVGVYLSEWEGQGIDRLSTERTTWSSRR